jgi:NADH:ubiquinone oxidoreductase subunit 6 (subunit J)
MLTLLLVLVLLIFAAQAIRSKALLTSALWLAGASAMTAILLFLYGAQQVAVIELSVGAGLVTVLFVFAINIAGDDAIDAAPVPPKPWIVGLVALLVLLLGWFVWPSHAAARVAVSGEQSLSMVMWQARGLDLIVQMALIFSGVLGLLGLLAEVKPPLEGSMAAEVSARRDEEMQLMDTQIVQIEEVVK